MRSSPEPLEHHGVVAALLALLRAWRETMGDVFRPLRGAARGTLPDADLQRAATEGLDRTFFGFLLTFNGNLQGNFAMILSGHTPIGREAFHGIAIEDSCVSAQHASLYADEDTGQVFVEDEGSTNGTVVNEQSLARGQRRELKDNDCVSFGTIAFVVKLVAPEQRAPFRNRYPAYR